VLLGEAPDRVRHRRGLHKKIVRLVGEHLAGARQIHHTINHHIGHMNLFRPQLPGQGLGEALRITIGREEDMAKVGDAIEAALER